MAEIRQWSQSTELRLPLAILEARGDCSQPGMPGLETSTINIIGINKHEFSRIGNPPAPAFYYCGSSGTVKFVHVGRQTIEQMRSRFEEISDE